MSDPLPVKWPTQQQWEQKFSAAIKAGSSGLTTSAAVRDVTATIGTVIETVTGKSLGSLVSEQLAQQVGKLAQTIAAGMAPEAIKQAGQAAGAVAEMIPLFAMAVESSLEAIQQNDDIIAARLKSMTERRVSGCRVRYYEAQPKPTGMGGRLTPADIFRPVVVELAQPMRARGLGSAQYPSRRYPLALGSLFCAILGPESPLGWNDMKRSIWTPPPMGMSAGGARVRHETVHVHGAKGYQQFIAAQRKRKPTLGLSLEVRRRLAVVVRGIMASTRPYTLAKIDQVGDQGQALFPILCDSLLHEWRAGRWDMEFLRALQDSQIHCLHVLDYQTGEVVGPVVDLSKEFDAAIMAWKSSVESAAFQPKVKMYLTSAAKRRLFRARLSTPFRRKRATLTRGPAPTRGPSAVEAGAMVAAIAAVLYGLLS